MASRLSPCPYCSTWANGFRLFGPRHPCFTVYDLVRPEGIEPPTNAV